MTTFEAITAAFPQSPSPAEVVVTGQDLTGPAMTHAIAEPKAKAAEGGPIREPVTASAVAGGRALIVSIPLSGNGGDTASFNALQVLHDRILPETLGRVGVSYAVTGDTASTVDDINQLRTRTPLVLAIAAVLAFCLLLLAFRSVVLPLVSITANLLSVGAAYGMLAWVFQDGRLQGLLGYTAFAAIVWWVPLFLFVFLFVLSTDYHIFILSRIRERWLYGDTTMDAITGGIAASADGHQRRDHHDGGVLHLRRRGPGRAENARHRPAGRRPAGRHHVRGIVLPAAMTLIGDRCWYLPRRLDWLHGSSKNQGTVLPPPWSLKQSHLSDGDGSSLSA